MRISKQNLDKVRLELGDKKLICVTKYVGPELIEELYALGERDIGENRLQDLERKAKELVARCEELRFHFIGNIQSNKVTKLLSIPSLVSIQSVSKLSVLKKILSHNIERPLDIFFQVNTSGEKEKGGVEDYTALKELALYYKDHQDRNIKLKGLMTIGKIRTQNFEAEAKQCFGELVKLRDKLCLDFPEFGVLELSMGMSSDYKIALEQGSDIIRVGGLLFEED